MGVRNGTEEKSNRFGGEVTEKAACSIPGRVNL